MTTTKKTTKTEPRLMGRMTIQGIAHWHRPKEWSWPQFKTDFEWRVTDVDLEHGIITVEFFETVEK
jgi:hypothetical protein